MDAGWRALASALVPPIGPQGAVTEAVRGRRGRENASSSHEPSHILTHRSDETFTSVCAADLSAADSQFCARVPKCPTFSLRPRGASSGSLEVCARGPTSRFPTARLAGHDWPIRSDRSAVVCAPAPQPMARR